jgi:hypothetical protein
MTSTAQVYVVLSHVYLRADDIGVPILNDVRIATPEIHTDHVTAVRRIGSDTTVAATDRATANRWFTTGQRVLNAIDPIVETVHAAKDELDKAQAALDAARAAATERITAILATYTDTDTDIATSVDAFTTMMREHAQAEHDAQQATLDRDEGPLAFRVTSPFVTVNNNRVATIHLLYCSVNTSNYDQHDMRGGDVEQFIDTKMLGIRPVSDIKLCGRCKPDTRLIELAPGTVEFCREYTERRNNTQPPLPSNMDKEIAKLQAALPWGTSATTGFAPVRRQGVKVARYEYLIGWVIQAKTLHEQPDLDEINKILAMFGWIGRRPYTVDGDVRLDECVAMRRMTIAEKSA